MGVDKLKNVRTQRYPHCVLLFCVWRLTSAYILCVPRAQADTDCALAFLRIWFQPRPRLGKRGPTSRPCWPAVAVLRARWGRNRSPPGERPCRATQGRFCANRCGGGWSSSGIFFLCPILQAKGQTAQPTVSYKKPPLWGRASRALVRRCRTARLAGSSPHPL